MPRPNQNPNKSPASKRLGKLDHFRNKKPSTRLLWYILYGGFRTLSNGKKLLMNRMSAKTYHGDATALGLQKPGPKSRVRKRDQRPYVSAAELRVTRLRPSPTEVDAAHRRGSKLSLEVGNIKRIEQVHGVN